MLVAQWVRGRESCGRVILARTVHMSRGNGKQGWKSLIRSRKAWTCDLLLLLSFGSAISEALGLLASPETSVRSQGGTPSRNPDLHPSMHAACPQLAQLQARPSFPCSQTLQTLRSYLFRMHSCRQGPASVELEPSSNTIIHPADSSHFSHSSHTKNAFRMCSCRQGPASVEHKPSSNTIIHHAIFYHSSDVSHFSHFSDVSHTKNTHFACAAAGKAQLPSRPRGVR